MGCSRQKRLLQCLPYVTTNYVFGCHRYGEGCREITLVKVGLTDKIYLQQS